MKTILIFSLAAILFVGLFQFTFAFETEQEPKPPQIPSPSPEPEPIKIPNPGPPPNPFPKEIESEKIQRLTRENNNLKQQNINLQGNISTLKNEKLKLQAEISELNGIIQNLEKITMEQIQIIMDLANQLKNILFEKIFPPTIKL